MEMDSEHREGGRKVAGRRTKQGKLRTRWRSIEPLREKQVPPTPRPSRRGWRRGGLFPPRSSSGVPRFHSSPQTVAVRGSWDPLLPCFSLAPPSSSRQLLIGCGEQPPSSPSPRRESSGSEVGGARTGSGSPSRVPVPRALCPDSRRAGAEGAKGTTAKGRSKSCRKRGAAASAAASAAAATKPASRAGLAGRARRRGERGASSWSTRTPTS